MSGRWAAKQVLAACGHPPGNPLLLLLGSSFSVIQMNFLKLVCYLWWLANVNSDSKRGLGRQYRQYRYVEEEECIPSLFIFLPLLWFSHAWRDLINVLSPRSLAEFSAFGGYQPSCAKAITSAFWSAAYQRAAELCTFFSLLFGFVLG